MLGLAGRGCAKVVVCVLGGVSPNMLGRVGDRSDNGRESVSTSSSEPVYREALCSGVSLAAKRGGSVGDSGGGKMPDVV